MEKKVLIFRHTPIDVDIKMYEYFANTLWKGEVVVYAETSFSAGRNICGYQQNAKGIRTIIVDEENMVFDNQFFYKNRKEIFIFYGLSMANKYLVFLKKYHLKYGIISERSLCFEKKKIVFARVLPLIRHIRSYYLLRNVRCFLAMGQAGIRCFSKEFLVQSSKMFDFMYNDGNEYLQPIYRKEGDAINFVYAGRFEYEHKGVDTLLDAFQNIDGNYTLDLIGGYGTNMREIIEKVKVMRNVNCLGPCDYEKMCETLNHYDVIIVPSRKDGWNLHCNLSINAGIGAIATNQSTSDELIKECGNGVIISAGSVDILRDSILNVLHNPEIIMNWKEKTVLYAPKISYIAVANYLYNIFEYSFNDYLKNERPVCPWL